jgi:hypothetical protein
MTKKKEKKKLISKDEKKEDVSLHQLFKTVTRVIRPYVQYMKKQQKLIPKKSK